MERMTAFVHGSVQGVGFRWWTRSRALELGLAGHATNMADGGGGPTRRLPAFARVVARGAFNHSPPGRGQHRGGAMVDAAGRKRIHRTLAP